MTTADAKLTATSFSATEQDRAHIAAIAEVLRQRGHRVMWGDKISATAVISYALARVFLTECSTDGATVPEQIAA